MLRRLPVRESSLGQLVITVVTSRRLGTVMGTAMRGRTGQTVGCGTTQVGVIDTAIRLPISSMETGPVRAQHPMGAIHTAVKHTHTLATRASVGGTAIITIKPAVTGTAAIILETIATILPNQIPPAPGDRKLTDDVMLPLETKNATANMASSDVTSFSCDKSTNQMSALK